MPRDGTDTTPYNGSKVEVLTMTMLKPRSGMKLTVEEFFALPETLENPKVELDEGVLHLMVKPGAVHQFFLAQLVAYFVNYLDGFDVPPALMFPDFLVALSLERRTLLAPDISIVLRDRAHLITGRMIEGPPDIVVEILSTDRNRDLVRKRHAYAEGGVAEYWIFDAANDAATLLELQNGDYDERAVQTGDDTLTTPLLPGLAIPLADVFRHRRRPQEE